MPYYKCTLINEQGSIKTKVIYAKNKKSLEDHHTNKEERIITTRRSLSHLLHTSVQFSSNIKVADFTLFNQKLVILLKSGTSFIKALQVIIAEMHSSTFKEILIKAEFVAKVWDKPTPKRATVKKANFLILNIYVL